MHLFYPLNFFAMYITRRISLANPRVTTRNRPAPNPHQSLSGPTRTATQNVGPRRPLVQTLRIPLLCEHIPVTIRKASGENKCAQQFRAFSLLVARLRKMERKKKVLYVSRFPFNKLPKSQYARKGKQFIVLYR